MRSRWLAVKVGLIGLVALASAGLLSLMASWWMTPIYQASAKANGDSGVDRLAPAVFGANGIVPIGYAAFGFALGLAFGVLIRRTIPAMAATLAVFAGIQVAWPRWIRPHLMSPLRATSPLNPVEDRRAGDRYAAAHVRAGGSLQAGRLDTREPDHRSGRAPVHGSGDQGLPGPGLQACNASVARLHLRQVAHLPAGQPVLGLPVVRDRDLPRRSPSR